MTAGPHAVPTLHVAHDSPGRLRVRVGDLRADRAAAVALADAVAGLDGVLQVSVRPRTNSVLCFYDERRTDAARVLAALRRQRMAPPRQRSAPADSGPPAKRLRRAVGDLFHALDADVVAATGGRLDLGTLTGLSLLGAGAAEIAVTRLIPAPPWFSLAWWAFRTFTMFDANGSDVEAAAPAARRTRAAAPRARP